MVFRLRRAALPRWLGVLAISLMEIPAPMRIATVGTLCVYLELLTESRIDKQLSGVD